MAEKKLTKRQKQRLIKGILTVVCLGILALLWFVIMPMLRDEYEVPEGVAEFHFIDVGQGDSTLIMSGGKNVLVDTGDRDAKESLTEYLDEHSVEVIEYFVITHFDSDHFANAVDVLESYDVVNLIIPNQVKNTKMYESFMDVAEEQSDSGEIEILFANDMVGESFEVNDIEITVLAPLSDSYKDSNDYSVVLMARFGNKRVLLTGDAEKEAEEDIVARYKASDLDCDVYKMGHHGSRTSSSKDLLDKATPDYVVISCGKGNSYGHPHAEAMERVEDLVKYRTDTQGTIVLSIENDELSFATEK